MSAELCPVCSKSSKSWVLCHRVGDYICEKHCGSCEYLRRIDWHCLWKGGPENQKYSAFKMHQLVGLLKAHPHGFVENYLLHAQKGANDILIYGKEPKDKLPYYWIRIEAAQKVLSGGEKT